MAGTLDAKVWTSNNGAAGWGDDGKLYQTPDVSAASNEVGGAGWILVGVEYNATNYEATFPGNVTSPETITAQYLRTDNGLHMVDGSDTSMTIRAGANFPGQLGTSADATINGCPARMIFQNLGDISTAQAAIKFADANQTIGSPLTGWTTPMTVRSTGDVIITGTVSAEGTATQRTWTGATQIRALGVAYTNNTGYDIDVSITVTYPTAGAASSVSLYVNSVLINNHQDTPSVARRATVYMTVPAGASYSATPVNATLYKWVELS